MMKLPGLSVVSVCCVKTAGALSVLSRAFCRGGKSVLLQAVQVGLVNGSRWAVRVGAAGIGSRCAVVVEGGWKSGRRKRRPPRVWDILRLGF